MKNQKGRQLKNNRLENQTLDKKVIQKAKMVKMQHQVVVHRNRNVLHAPPAPAKELQGNLQENRQEKVKNLLSLSRVMKRIKFKQGRVPVILLHSPCYKPWKV